MFTRTRIITLVTLVAVAGAAVLAIELSSFLKDDIRDAAMAIRVERAEGTLRGELTRLFDPLGAQLSITERWSERGLLDVGDHKKLNALFMPMLEQFPHVSSMMIANERGEEYMLQHVDGAWRTRATDANDNLGRVRWQRWADEDSLVDESWQEVAYDPRERPWYQAALKGEGADARGVAWTRPYQFFTTKQIGVTLSKKWQAGDPEITHVAGYDVPLENILPMLDSLDVAGVCFLFNDEGRVYAGKDADPDTGTRDPSTLEAAVVETWLASGRAFGRRLRLTSAGVTWWVDFRRIGTDGTAPSLAVVVAQGVFDGAVENRQHRYIAVVLGLLGLGALLTFPVTQLFGSRGRAESSVQFGQDVLDLIATGESDRLEFKSTMRWNLHQDKAGKEVEMAWLKAVIAFMNTGGGTILIGVNDEGEVTGVAADQFANDDKLFLHFNNLIKQHVGLAFSQFIRARLIEAGAHKVLVIECSKSSEPAFLIQGKEERFYVRVGPSSRQLPPSEVLKRFRGAS